MNDTEYLDALAAHMKAPKAPAAMAKLVVSDSDPEAAVQAEAALGFYVHSNHARRLSFVRHAFPGLLKSLPEADRKVLTDRFLAGSGGTNEDWAWAAVVFLDAVQALCREGTLSDRVEARARHLWRLFEARQHRDVPPAAANVTQLQVNPTLFMEEYPVDPTDELTAPERRGSTALGYYTHPATLLPHWVRFEPHVFAAMRIADEQIPARAAAAEAGLDVPAVEAMLRKYVDMGLLAGR